MKQLHLNLIFGSALYFTEFYPVPKSFVQVKNGNFRNEIDSHDRKGKLKLARYHERNDKSGYRTGNTVRERFN